MAYYSQLKTQLSVPIAETARRTSATKIPKPDSIDWTVGPSDEVWSTVWLLGLD